MIIHILFWKLTNPAARKPTPPSGALSLVEGAALIMNSHELYRAAQDPLVELLAAFKDQLNQGYINGGENGELTARLLRTIPVIGIDLILSSLGKGSSNTGIMVEGLAFHRCYLCTTKTHIC